MRLENKPILNKEDSLCICIDLQERLLPAMHNLDELIKNANILLKMSEIYDIPVLATEQYPKGLGNTDSRIVLPKNHKLFSKNPINKDFNKYFITKFC